MLIYQAPAEMWFGTRLCPFGARPERMPSDRQWDRRITKDGITVVYDLSEPGKPWLSNHPAATALIRRLDRKALKSGESVTDAFIVERREAWTSAVFYCQSKPNFKLTVLRFIDRADCYFDHEARGSCAHKIYVRNHKHLGLVANALTPSRQQVVVVRPADGADKISIDLNDTLSEIPYSVLRRYFRTIRDALTASSLGFDLGLPPARAEAVIEALSNAGLIEPHQHHQQFFQLTTKGQSLAQTLTIQRMNRVTIDKLVVSVHQRALEVNADDRFIMQFEMLGIFGSVMDQQAQDFGDLDVVYRLGYKPKWQKRLDDRNWHDDMLAFHLQHFPQDRNVWYGYQFYRIEQRPLQHIRGRQQRISVHTEHDLRGLEEKHPVPSRLLFGKRAVR